MADEFLIGANSRYQVDRIGAEGAPVIVIDDFLRDADLLVQHAASQRFSPVTHRRYPGICAPTPAIYVAAVRGILAPLLATTFGLENLAIYDSESSYSILTQRPDTLRPRQRLPSFDSSDSHLIALLHYLCPAGHGGTSFYRHRSTGYEGINDERLPYFDRAIERELAEPQPPAYVNGATRHFARTASYAAEFNRMLVYRSASLHAADLPANVLPDPDPRTGRLTAHTFFLFRPPQTEPRSSLAR